MCWSMPASAGFAHSAYLTHGTTVSRDRADGAGRGRRLRPRDGRCWRQPHLQEQAQGELRIPAIRGVGGSVLAASRRGVGPWRGSGSVDFAATPAAAGAGITGIDHIGQTMAYDEMLSWSLFYTSIFDARKAPMVDVADPDGLVRSQAIRAGGLRVTLNGAEARRTLAGRFIEDSFGASVQHVAFAAPDIFATAEALAARGLCRAADRRRTTTPNRRRASAWTPSLSRGCSAGEHHV